MSSSNENDFKTEFLKLVDGCGLQVQEEWEAPFPEFMPVLAKFIDIGKNRIFTIEESSDFEFSCDYVIRKTGMNFEQYDMLLRFQEACSNFDLILDIYSRWFIKRHSVREMESYLSGVCK